MTQRTERQPVVEPSPVVEPVETPAAVLWDFDGTIVDTEPYWIEAETELVATYGGAWSHEQAMKLVGNDLLVSAAIIIAEAGVPLTPTEVVDRLLDRIVELVAHEIPWRPGARELLAHLRASGTPCGLVTMSYLRFVQPVLDALPAGTFDCVVTGETVTDGKPHPEAYQVAARSLGVDPAHCVAIEDSPTGAASALAAGCRVVGVPLHVPLPARPGMVVVDALPADAAALRAVTAR